MKVIFHTGMVKTGSTFIQEMIRENRGMLAELIGLAVKDERAERLREAGKQYGRKPNPRRRRILDQEARHFFESVQRDGHDVTLFSDETLMGAAPYSTSGHVFEWGSDILAIIEQARGEIDVEFIIYHREFEKWESSIYNQLVKFDGLTTSFVEWQNAQPYPRSWASNFKTLSKNVKESIIFVDMKSDLDSGLLGRTLFEHAGIPKAKIDSMKQPEPQNTSLNQGSLNFMLEVNRSGMPQRARRKIANITSRHQDLFAANANLDSRVQPPARITPVKSKQSFSSENYWKRRYKRGGNSGAGSYGRLADYKSEYINDLVSRYGVESVVEIGSGDGNQASEYTFSPYTGIDLSAKMVAECRKRFSDRKDWNFSTASEWVLKPHDMSMSLDVIYHLIEDGVYEAYMNQLFNSALRYVLIYVSDKDTQHSAKHVKHRNFSEWVAENRGDWELLEAPKHPFPMIAGSDPNQTSFASFKLFEARNA
jgi:hypothetical protein